MSVRVYRYIYIYIHTTTLYYYTHVWVQYFLMNITNEYQAIFYKFRFLYYWSDSECM